MYDLKYDEYYTTINTGLSDLLETADNADVTFAVQGMFFKAHKLVLSISSLYCRELFRANPCQHPIIFMKDIKPEVMQNLLMFIYRGRAQVTEEDLSEFITLAKALRVNGLENIECVQATDMKSEVSHMPLVQHNNEPNVTSMLHESDDSPDFIDMGCAHKTNQQLSTINTKSDETNENLTNCANKIVRKPRQSVEAIIFKKGKSSILQLHGYTYYRHRALRLNWIRWRCNRCPNGKAHRTCPATVSTNHDNQLIFNYSHDHEPYERPPDAQEICREVYRVVSSKGCAI